MSEIFPETPAAPSTVAIRKDDLDVLAAAVTTWAPHDLPPEMQDAFARMLNAFDKAHVGDDAPADAPEPPERYALVEQMGHRATTATVREVTFCGKQALEVTDLKTGSVHVVFPDSLYEITWLTEADARARAKPWTATAIAAGSYDSWDDRDDADRRANGEDDSDPGDEL